MRSAKNVVVEFHSKQTQLTYYLSQLNSPKGLQIPYCDLRTNFYDDDILPLLLLLAKYVHIKAVVWNGSSVFDLFENWKLDFWNKPSNPISRTPSPDFWNKLIFDHDLVPTLFDPTTNFGLPLKCNYNIYAPVPIKCNPYNSCLTLGWSQSRNHRFPWAITI